MPYRVEALAQGDLSELFHRAFRELRNSWVEQLAPFELTPHQFRAMQALARTSLETPGSEGMRLKDVAERLHIAARSATEVVDQLEAKTLVLRTADQMDRRATLVKLTPAGLELSDRVRAARRAHTEEYFGRLNPSDRAELARILAQLGPT